MKGNSSKSAVLSLAQKCKNILAANCQACLNTIKADATGSKNEIHSSKVMYLLRKGRPYLWIREEDLHNVNAIIDERASLSVRSPIPGSFFSLLRSINKVPSHVAITGDLIRLEDDKVHFALKSLKDVITLEFEAISNASYSVSSILNSAGTNCKLRGEFFQEIAEESRNYAIHKFHISSCSYVDGSGDIHEVGVDDVDESKADNLAPFSEKLIDGINQSQARRRALVLLCLVHFNINAQDALMLAIDWKGFDVLAKVPTRATTNSHNAYQWRELRFMFEEEVAGIEGFCSTLVQMEEEALKCVKSFSGIG